MSHDTIDAEDFLAGLKEHLRRALRITDTNHPFFRATAIEVKVNNDSFTVIYTVDGVASTVESK